MDQLPKASLDAIARELVGAEVPGLAAHQQACRSARGTQLAGAHGSCRCTQLALESFAAARDDDVSLAMVQRVAKHMGVFYEGVREWHVRAGHEWLLPRPYHRIGVSSAAGEKLAAYVAPRAAVRKSQALRKRARGQDRAAGGADAGDDSQAAPEVEPEAEPPYQRYASSEQMLPGLTRTAESSVHTEAQRRRARVAASAKGRTTKSDAPVSPKRRITSWFTAPAASSS